jgi:XTP/dITP diphosphohydrolase/tetrapyrrole methylase family protein/MazG family protein/ATP diphosphatase
MPVNLIVALGPGEPELVPAAALAALADHGSCTLDEDAAGLAPLLLETGIDLGPDDDVLAATDGMALALADQHGAPTLPARPLLERQAAGRAAGALLELTARLRRDCPWDRAQDASSIIPHTVEEAYEVAEAVQADGLGEKLVDELGDLLFQTTFLALLLQEAGVGTWRDVAEGVTAKLIRRHPHVFGDDAASSAGEVKHRWEARKRTHEDREGIFHDVPAVLPGLQYAAKIQRRALSVGFEYPTAQGAFEDLTRELAELREEVEGRTAPAPELPADPDDAGELGDLLFAAVNVSRRWNTDPELAIRAAANRFRDRVERAEALAAADGVVFSGAGLDVQEGYYQAAKRELRERDGAAGQTPTPERGR